MNMTSIIAKTDKPISFKKFLKKYAKKEDEFRYEWNNGQVEKSGGIYQSKLLIQRNLLQMFVKTPAFKNGGMLISAGKIQTSNSLRYPDFAFYTSEQIANFSDLNDEIPLWVGEVVSKVDTVVVMQTRLEDYFNSGVKVVWQILPRLEKVYVYTSFIEATVSTNKTICSGSPAIEDFNIAAQDIFTK